MQIFLLECANVYGKDDCDNFIKEYGCGHEGVKFYCSKSCHMCGIGKFEKIFRDNFIASFDEMISKQGMPY